jgi:hypothetical protein
MWFIWNLQWNIYFGFRSRFKSFRVLCFLCSQCIALYLGTFFPTGKQLSIRPKKIKFEIYVSVKLRFLYWPNFKTTDAKVTGKSPNSDTETAQMKHGFPRNELKFSVIPPLVSYFRAACTYFKMRVACTVFSIATRIKNGDKLSSLSLAYWCEVKGKRRVWITHSFLSTPSEESAMLQRWKLLLKQNFKGEFSLSSFPLFHFSSYFVFTSIDYDHWESGLVQWIECYFDCFLIIFQSSDVVHCVSKLHYLARWRNMEASIRAKCLQKFMGSFF